MSNETGPAPTTTATMGTTATRSDLNGREVLSMLPLAAGCVVIGLWPQPILDAIKPVARDVVAPYTALIERSQRDGAATAAAIAPAAGSDATATTGGMP